MSTRLTLHDMTKWDHRFLALCKHIAQWSKDPSTQVGAVIVDDERRVIGMGYNGFPRGVMDTPERYADRPTKYQYVVHAEANAVLNATASVANHSLYCYPFPPCAECAKLIIQSGICRVVCPVPDDEQLARWGQAFEVAETMFHEARVKLWLTP